MLTRVGTPSPLQVAAGQYVTVSLQVQSDRDLTGQVLRLNPATFSTLSPPAGVTDVYSLVYPTAPGTYPMQLDGPAVWGRHRVEITVLSPRSFRLTLGFIATSLTGFIGGATAPNPAQPFTPYASTDSAVGLHLRAGSDELTTYVPVALRPFCGGSDVEFVFSTRKTEGRQRITAKINPKANSDVFVGVYRTRGATGGRGVVADIDLHYAKAGSSTPQDVDGLPRTAFIKALRYDPSSGTDGGKSLIYIDLDTDYAEVDYRVYVVYNNGEGWESCVSQAKPAPELPVIAGDISYSLDDGTTEYTEGCLTSIPPCKSFAVTVRMDAASYRAALTAAGLDGDMTDYFRGVSVTRQASFTGLPSGPALLVSQGIDVNGAFATVQHEVDPGTTFLVFAFRFKLPTESQVVYCPVQLSAVDYGQLIAPDKVCAEQAEALRIDLPAALPDGRVVVTQYDRAGQYEAGQGVVTDGTAIEIDPTTIPLGTSRCYEVCVEQNVPAAQPCTCDCGCVNVYFQVKPNSDGQTYTYTVGVNRPDLLASKIKTLNGGGQTVTGQARITGTGTIRGASYGDPQDVYLSAVVTLEDGCVFRSPLQTLSPANGDDVPNLKLCEATCDCADVPPPPPECDNFASITHACTDDGVLTIEHTQDFSATVATDVIECSLNGQTWGACQASYSTPVRVRRRVTFTEACPPIALDYQAACEVQADCLNTADLELEQTDTALTLTVVGDYSSQAVTETAYYSLNGGKTFEDYTGPVTITGSEDIRAYAVVRFGDGCPTITTPIQSGAGQLNTADPFVAYCDEAGETTGYAAVSFADGLPQTTYFDNKLRQQASPPAGSPCEAFAPCSTC
ncbi:hypothetical protein LEM8419_03561 [Neolewinella maritima]|uniref:Uncharacterized protein n=1 Tax=Neolewinella maritima TaxID=1383882 RepID=A0ABN8FB96_9BACT|nr:hypothetical protein [Neolewinella maritima]CAH1002689.1 hypothetical protein LEM8419_03561 [Neolewinella maritima]